MDQANISKLQTVVSSPGYQVILDLMEQECDLAERELLRADPANTALVVASHNRAQAFRLLFERFQASVQRELLTGAAINVKPLTLSPLNLMKRQCQE